MFGIVFSIDVNICITNDIVSAQVLLALNVRNNRLVDLTSLTGIT